MYILKKLIDTRANLQTPMTHMVGSTRRHSPRPFLSSRHHSRHRRGAYRNALLPRHRTVRFATSLHMYMTTLHTTQIRKFEQHITVPTGSGRPNFSLRLAIFSAASVSVTGAMRPNLSTRFASRLASAAAAASVAVTTATGAAVAAASSATAVVASAAGVPSCTLVKKCTEKTRRC